MEDFVGRYIDTPGVNGIVCFVCGRIGHSGRINEGLLPEAVDRRSQTV